VAFNSFQYALLLCLVVALFWALAPPARRWLVLGASYVFYASWDVRFTVLLFASSTVAFAAGRAIGASEDPKARRRVRNLAVLFNLVLLGFFKYCNFFLDSTSELLDRLGLASPDWALRIALPVGISFFTFQMLSYVIDVSRRETDVEQSYLTFLIYGSFFPHLLAGPICRARRLIPQLGFTKKAPSPVQVAEGLELLLLGLFMKVAVADALNQVTGPIFAAFSDPTAARPSWISLWAATLGSVIQFILDFAGYSNIARGSSKLIGVELPYNFRQPLTRSSDFQDFWRREHMTLMAWFRDYVYRPLHRRNASPWYDHGVLLLLFALSGLWHGAGWIWVTWGLLVGATLVVELEVKRRRNLRARAARVRAPAPISPRVDPDAAAQADPDAALLGEANHVAPEAGPLPAPPGGPVPAVVAGAVATATAAPTRRPRPAGPAWWRVLPARTYVFVLIALQVAWIRTGQVGTGLKLYGALLHPRFAAVDVNMGFLFLYALGAMILVDRRQVQMEAVEGTRDPITLARGLGFGLMIMLIIVFSGAPPQQFVYFKF